MKVKERTGAGDVGGAKKGGCGMCTWENAEEAVVRLVGGFEVVVVVVVTSLVAWGAACEDEGIGGRCRAVRCIRTTTTTTTSTSNELLRGAEEMTIIPEVHALLMITMTLKPDTEHLGR